MKDKLTNLRVSRMLAYRDLISRTSHLLSSDLDLAEKERLIWQLSADLRDAEDMRPAGGWPDKPAQKPHDSVSVWLLIAFMAFLLIILPALFLLVRYKLSHP